jgi:hypothetical protein
MDNCGGGFAAIEATENCIGITQDDRDRVYLGMELV